MLRCALPTEAILARGVSSDKEVTMNAEGHEMFPRSRSYTAGKSQVGIGLDREEIPVRRIQLCAASIRVWGTQRHGSNREPRKEHHSFRDAGHQKNMTFLSKGFGILRCCCQVSGRLVAVPG